MIFPTKSMPICGILATLGFVLAASPSRGALIAPYTPDADTLHLWHLDEADPGPASDTGNGTTFPLGPTGGASLGAASYSGFGTAADTSGAVAEGFSSAAAVPVADVVGAGGAFTFEAMIRTTNITNIQQIVSMDNAAANNLRPFQFRIDAGQLRFINIGGSGVEQILTLIPTTGPDAFVADEWFHAAVTYNGNENTADNIKLYWTRVDPSRTQANEIFSTTMLEDLTGNDTVFGVGNEYRSAQDNNMNGLIDEVRISGIARGAGDMLFGIPEPSSVTLVGLGVLALLGRRRR